MYSLYVLGFAAFYALNTIKAGNLIECITRSRQPWIVFLQFFDPVTLTFDLILIGGRGIVMDYITVPIKFGDCTFNRFGFIVRTDRQTHTDTHTHTHRCIRLPYSRANTVDVSNDNDGDEMMNIVGAALAYGCGQW